MQGALPIFPIAAVSAISKQNEEADPIFAELAVYIGIDVFICQDVADRLTLKTCIFFPN